jgi:hypothetical protein
MEGYEKARVAARAAEDKRADDVVILDLREHTLVADFFVVATGQTVVQLRAIADPSQQPDSARFLIRERGLPPRRAIPIPVLAFPAEAESPLQGEGMAVREPGRTATP